MAAAIRIKLADLLSILMEKPPAVNESRTKQIRLFATAERRPLNRGIEEDLEAIKAYLQNGPARRSDLEMELNMSKDSVLRRLGMLRAAGEIVSLPDRGYQLREVSPCTQ